jgi:hypothetical protein
MVEALLKEGESPKKRWETIVDPQYMDQVAYKSSERGKRKPKILYDSNLEEN